MQNTHTRKTAYTFFLYFTTDLQNKPNRRFFQTEPAVFLKTEPNLKNPFRTSLITSNVHSVTRVNGYVSVEVAVPEKRLITHKTYVRLIASVNAFVNLEIAGPTEGSVTHVTDVWFITRVRALVLQEVVGMSKCFVTYIAYVRLIAGVTAHVSDKIAVVTKRFVALVAAVRSISRVSTLVFLEITGLRKCFVAYVAAVRRFAVNAFVHVQIIDKSKRFATYIAHVRYSTCVVVVKFLVSIETPQTAVSPMTHVTLKRFLSSAGFAVHLVTCVAVRFAFSNFYLLISLHLT